MIGRRRKRHGIGFLARLRRDIRGNVLAIAAFSLIPLIGMVGGGIDLSRMYLVKARIQHACDAGTLAGRKAMGAGTWAQTNPNPQAIANQFYDGNFRSDGLTTLNPSRTFSESGGMVSGRAQVDVPMTMMRFFGAPTRTLVVTCSAKMQIPNTDVMFVLDVTGSMACLPSESSCSQAQPYRSGSKILVLKNAVKCFYESVTQLTTNGDCSDANSTGQGINNSSQVRFGFVPYNTNVNLSSVISASNWNNDWLANAWNYQTRTGNWSGEVYDPSSTTSMPSGGCPNKTDTAFVKYKTYAYYGNCYYSKNTLTWTYGCQSITVSGLKSGSFPRTMTQPIGNGKTDKTITWEGCIEERSTVSASSYDPIPSGANDLDIDTPPTAGDTTAVRKTQWAPALRDLIYLRRMTSNDNSQLDGTDPYQVSADYTGLSSNNFFCPTPAQKLKVWSTSDFDTYVDSLSASGNTHHDIGMIWGGRLLSPSGIFKSENAATPSGGAIQRNMVFMTDGDAQAAQCDYGSYGLPFFDKRTTSTVGSASNCSYMDTEATNQVNLRLAGLCTAVKNKGVNLYVISFGGNGIAADTKTRLKNCASDDAHYFDATSATDLNNAFQTIAAQITQLRLQS